MIIKFFVHAHLGIIMYTMPSTASHLIPTSCQPASSQSGSPLTHRVWVSLSISFFHLKLAIVAIHHIIGINKIFKILFSHPKSRVVGTFNSNCISINLNYGYYWFKEKSFLIMITYKNENDINTFHSVPNTELNGPKWMRYRSEMNWIK